jgi:hypothetical protein
MKYNQFIFIVSILSLFFCNSCNKDTGFEKIDLHPSLVISQLSDSSYFKDIYFMNYYKNSIYASDNYNGRILRLDKNLNLISSIGNSGQGPGEFVELGCTEVFNDTLYAIDSQRMSLFSLDGKLINTYNNVNANKATFNKFCVDNGGSFYFNSVLDNGPVVKYDKFMTEKFAFGDWNELQNTEYKVASNQFDILFFQDKVLSINQEQPQFNFYDKNGTLLSSDYINDEIFSSRLNFRKSEHEKNIANKKKTYKLFSSVTTYKNKIFLLYIDHNKENGRPLCNKIVELMYEDNILKINKVYQLEDSWYSSICCTSDGLICYDATTTELSLCKLKF